MMTYHNVIETAKMLALFALVPPIWNVSAAIIEYIEFIIHMMELTRG